MQSLHYYLLVLGQYNVSYGKVWVRNVPHCFGALYKKLEHVQLSRELVAHSLISLKLNN